MTTVTKLDQNIQKAEAYLDKIVGTPYSWWIGGTVPDGAPAWARNGPPPPPANVKGTSCFCAGVTNLARRAVGLEIPTLGNPDYDGGVVAYFGSTDAAPRPSPGRVTSRGTTGSAGSTSRKRTVPGPLSGASTAT